MDEGRRPFGLLAGAEIDHVEVFVSDRAAAVDWYWRVLGLEPVAAWQHWATPRGPLMLSSAHGRSMVALFEREPCPDRQAEHHRLAFRVSGPEFISFARIGATGPVYDESGRPLDALTPVDHGESFSVYFCDPWGNRCEVTTYDAQYVTVHGDVGSAIRADTRSPDAPISR